MQINGIMYPMKKTITTLLAAATLSLFSVFTVGTQANLEWAQADNLEWAQTLDNLEWAMVTDNLEWATGDNLEWA